MPSTSTICAGIRIGREIRCGQDICDLNIKSRSGKARDRLVAVRKWSANGQTLFKKGMEKKWGKENRERWYPVTVGGIYKRRARSHFVYLLEHQPLLALGRRRTKAVPVFSRPAGGFRWTSPSQGLLTSAWEMHNRDLPAVSLLTYEDHSCLPISKADLISVSKSGCLARVY